MLNKNRHHAEKQEEIKAAIKQFFAARNKRIIKTGLDYTQNNVNSVNKAYVGLAKLAAEITDINYIKLLMPNLIAISDSVDATTPAGTAWSEEVISYYILSDDHTDLVPVLDSLSQGDDVSGWQPGYYGKDQKRRLLSAAEINRARTHSPKADSYYAQLLKDQAAQHKTLSDIIKQFSTQLHEHSVYSYIGRQRGATENAAAPGVLQVMEDFNNFWRGLPLDLQTTIADLPIEARNLHGYARKFSDILQELANRTCAGIIHNLLDGFLEVPENALVLGENILAGKLKEFQNAYGANITQLKVKTVVTEEPTISASELKIAKKIKIYFVLLGAIKNIIEFINNLRRRLWQNLTVLRMQKLLSIAATIGSLFPFVYFFFFFCYVQFGYPMLVLCMVVSYVIFLVSMLRTMFFYDFGRGGSRYVFVNIILFIVNAALVFLYSNAVASVIISKLAGIMATAIAYAWAHLIIFIKSSFALLVLDFTSFGLPIFTAIVVTVGILSLANIILNCTRYKFLNSYINAISKILASSIAIITLGIIGSVALEIVLLTLGVPAMAVTVCMFASILALAVVEYFGLVMLFIYSIDSWRYGAAVEKVCTIINTIGALAGTFALAALFEPGTALFITLGKLMLGSGAVTAEITTFGFFAVGYAVPCLAVIALGFAGKKLLDSYAPDALPAVQRHVGQAWRTVADTADAVVDEVGYQVRRLVRGY